MSQAKKDTHDIRLELDGLKVLQRTRLEHKQAGKALPCVEELVVDWTPRVLDGHIGVPILANVLQRAGCIKVLWALEPFEATHLNGVANPVFHFNLVRDPRHPCVDDSPVPHMWLLLARQEISKEFDKHWGFDLVQGLFTGLRHK